MTIAALATAAPPDAVTIAPWGDAFRNALANVVPSPVDDIRPSLLPARHERDRVIELFTALVGVS